MKLSSIKLSGMNLGSLRFATTSLLMTLNIVLLLIGGLSLWAGILTIMMLKTATSAATPPTTPISSRAI